MRRHAETKGRSWSVTSLYTLLTLILSLAALAWLPGSARAGDRVTFRMNWYWRGDSSAVRARARAPLLRAGRSGRRAAGGPGLGHDRPARGDEGRYVRLRRRVHGHAERRAGDPRGRWRRRSTDPRLPSSCWRTLRSERSGTSRAGRLGITPGDGHTQVWPAVVAANRLRGDQIQLVQMDPKAKGPALAERRVDAVLGSAADLPVTLGLRGIRTRVLTFTEVGVPAVGFTIIAHPDTIRDRPDVVRKLVVASVRGFEEAAREPEAAVRALARLAPLLEVDAARQQLLVDLSFLFSPANVRRRMAYGPPRLAGDPRRAQAVPRARHGAARRGLLHERVRAVTGSPAPRAR